MKKEKNTEVNYLIFIISILFIFFARGGRLDRKGGHAIGSLALWLIGSPCIHISLPAYILINPPPLDTMHSFSAYCPL